MSDKNMYEEVKRRLDTVVDECMLAFEDINDATRKVIANCERKAKKEKRVLIVVGIVVIGVGIALLVNDWLMIG